MLGAQATRSDKHEGKRARRRGGGRDNAGGGGTRRERAARQASGGRLEERRLEPCSFDMICVEGCLHLGSICTSMICRKDVRLSDAANHARQNTVCDGCACHELCGTS